MSTEQLTAEEQAAMDAMRSEPVEMKEPDAREEAEPQEEVAEAPAAEEPAPVEDKPEPKADKPPEGFVPHGALHKERRERQEAERQLAELRERLAKLEQAKPAEPEPDIPDPLSDPDGFKAWQRAELKKRDDAIAQFRQEQEQSRRQAMLAQHVASQEAEFRAQTPDYADAIKHLAQVRGQELRLFGLDDARIADTLNREAMEIAQAALQQGRNPAEVAYEIAKARGYARKAEAATEAVNPVSEAARVMALAKAQAQTQTLASAPGGGSAPKYTLAMLAAMSEAELAQIPEAEKRKVMGG